MSQIRNRNGQLQHDPSDALPMGAFRPNPSWFEEHWLVESRPAPPGMARQSLVRLAGFLSALIKRRFVALRSTEPLVVPKPQTH